jgi:hypothetical protein
VQAFIDLDLGNQEGEFMSATATVTAPVNPTSILPLLPRLAPEVIPGTYEIDLEGDAHVAYDPVAQLTYPAFTQPPEILAKGKTGTRCFEGTTTWFNDWSVDFIIDDAQD